MLFGENFSGRHHGALRAAFHGIEKGAHGHYGFARTDIALQQPVHGPRLSHVRLNFTKHALLRRRKPERQRGQKFLSHVSGRRKGLPRQEALRMHLSRHQHQLNTEKLFEHHAVPGALGLLKQIGKVYLS